MNLYIFLGLVWGFALGYAVATAVAIREYSRRDK
jgi:hypothetical protein